MSHTGRTRYAHTFTKFDPARPQVMPPQHEPTLSLLIVKGEGLRIACRLCSRDRRMSGLEAVASYGGLLTFTEVRAVIHGRCRIKPCEATVSVNLASNNRNGEK
jgi:hypothetical protein